MSNKEERFFKKKTIEDFNPSNTFVKVDSREFQRPFTLSIERIGSMLEINTGRDLSQMNVTAVEFSKQDQNPAIPPNTFPISSKAHISVDENFLYVWVPQSSSWKRILLSEWPQI